MSLEASYRTVAVDQARTLLDFQGRPGTRISDQLADSQLEGAVAAHNLLQTNGLAYVADEVGTGKTLVAAGALALLRHHTPTLNALVISPRANLQDKWRRELESFARHNVRYPDLRVRGLGSEPVRKPVVVQNLKDLASRWTASPNADLLARLSSFELGHSEDNRKAVVDYWRELLGDDRTEAVSMVLSRARGKEGTKLAIAACINSALPDIGVLVVDEAHTLKAGKGPRASDRNRVLWTMLGLNPDFAQTVPGYRRLTGRVLLMSATPLEESTGQILGQLEVTGAAESASGLADADESIRRRALHGFLFRRMTKLSVQGAPLTRNRYRQEWRSGGTVSPDEPLALDTPRDRLTFALVQKKVSEAIDSKGSGRHFQIGMLTSFESLAESTRSAQRAGVGQGADGVDDGSEFDDAEQNRAATEEERQGIDRDAIRDLMDSHRTEFGHAPVHPKVDAIVERLAEGCRIGRKALVFTRRVASVDEIVERLNVRIDADMFARIRAELPGLDRDVDRLESAYHAKGTDAGGSHPVSEYPGARQEPTIGAEHSDVTDDEEQGEVLDEAVRGGSSLFAWLFRDSTDSGLLTGRFLRDRLERQGGTYRTLFQHNYAAAILGCTPSEVDAAMRSELPDVDDVVAAVNLGAQQYLPVGRDVKRDVRFRAANYAAAALLCRARTPKVRERAVIAHAYFSRTALANSYSRSRMTPVAERLGEFTLSSLLVEDRELCSEIWGELLPWEWATEAEFEEREWRWSLLSAACRLDFPAIDLWLTEVRRNGGVETSAHVADPARLAEGFLDVLREQRKSSRDGWTSYRALKVLADDAGLVMDVNGLSASDGGVPAWIGNRVPAVGMSGRVNRTAVQQFRTPTYPMVLVTTDLLQEGEDLHTFCDEVHHYGIAWMPSAIEQRTGRVDRVNSLTERRLSSDAASLGVDGRPVAGQRLHVLYPFVDRTYEQLQVRRVLERLDEHIRLLHESFGGGRKASPRLDVGVELIDSAPIAEASENLGEPYSIRPEWLNGSRKKFPVVSDRHVADVVAAFQALTESDVLAGLSVRWSSTRRTAPTHLLGEGLIGDRIQPLDLRLVSVGGEAAVRVVSPVGHLGEDELDLLIKSAYDMSPDVRIGVTALGPGEYRSFNVTVEDQVPVGAVGRMRVGIAQSVRLVLEAADRLELAVLGSDLPLSEVEADLEGDCRRD